MENQSQIEINGYVLEPKAHDCLMVKRLTPKGKIPYKVVENYRFRTESQRDERVKYWKEKLTAALIEKEQEKIKLAALKSTFDINDHFKVGDVVYNSWGWEQTNIEFYQVVSVKGSKIVCKELRQRLTDSGGSSMSANTVPIIDDFLNNQITLTVKPAFHGFKICPLKSHYYFSKWDGTPKYCSWYA